MGGIIMNKNIDLTKILKGCPEGTEFYSSVYGRIAFVKVISNKYYPILMKQYQEGNNSNDIALFTKDGKANYQYNGECILFPSKDQRDWSKFERFWDKPKVEKFDPKTLQPFDKVLVRDEDCYWTADLFSHIDNSLGRVCCSWYSWKQCVPYNEGTKHLVGTNKDCPEFYKWWEE